MNRQEIYRSNGKLIITGEYAVLDGALSLAVPLKLGQRMSISERKLNGSKLSWEATDINGLWFTAIVSAKSFQIIETNNLPVADNLVKCLNAASKLNSSFLDSCQSWNISNHCGFDRNWGLGSSSTFISNISDWARVDPFELNSLISNGSGYDIACARSRKPILYSWKNKQPEFFETNFNPPFKDNLFLVYLNHKKNTDQSIEDYCSSGKKNINFIEKISGITNRIVHSETINDFMTLIFEHEKIMSEVLKLQPVKEKLFKDFPGEIKSLGAWGGDFVLVASELSRRFVHSYFREKGYNVIIPFKKIARLG